MKETREFTRLKNEQQFREYFENYFLGWKEMVIINGIRFFATYDDDINLIIENEYEKFKFNNIDEAIETFY